MRRSVLSVPLLVAMSAAALFQLSANGARAGNDPLGGSVTMDSRAMTLALDKTRSTVVPALPSPPGGDEQRASDYLKAAQGALAAGRTGEARQALEMAQTRMLDRSVPMGQTNNPNDNPTVQQISGALQALASHDRATCMQLIDTAIASATAQGF
jgi:hypothetical protein